MDWAWLAQSGLGVQRGLDPRRNPWGLTKVVLTLCNVYGYIRHGPAMGLSKMACVPCASHSAREWLAQLRWLATKKKMEMLLEACEMRGHSFLNWYLTADHIQIRYSQSLGRRRRRMYYCGGPYKEQAGTVPTYNMPIDCTLQSSTAQSLRKHKHKCAPKHRTKKLGRRAWPVPSRTPEEREKLVAEHISKRPREMQDTCFTVEAPTRGVQSGWVKLAYQFSVMWPFVVQRNVPSCPTKRNNLKIDEKGAQ
ncbi:hypothetical protein B0H13DRAFT_1905466 [Mycena leptocephala]|nr:hypothetical protein B0H13DRAFT_1905466 [Mycena leptocephala]